MSVVNECDMHGRGSPYDHPGSGIVVDRCLHVGDRYVVESRAVETGMRVLQSGRHLGQHVVDPYEMAYAYTKDQADVVWASLVAMISEAA